MPTTATHRMRRCRTTASPTCSNTPALRCSMPMFTTPSMSAPRCRSVLATRSSTGAKVSSSRASTSSTRSTCRSCASRAPKSRKRSCQCGASMPTSPSAAARRSKPSTSSNGRKPWSTVVAATIRPSRTRLPPMPRAAPAAPASPRWLIRVRDVYPHLPWWQRVSTPPSPKARKARIPGNMASHCACRSRRSTPRWVCTE